MHECQLNPVELACDTPRFNTLNLLPSVISQAYGTPSNLCRVTITCVVRMSRHRPARHAHFKPLKIVRVVAEKLLIELIKSHHNVNHK